MDAASKDVLIVDKLQSLEANDAAAAADSEEEEFHPIKNMQVSYFSIPMAIGGLAVALKVAGDWVEQWAQAALGSVGIHIDVAILLPEDLDTIKDAWWHTFGMAAFCIYLILFVLLLFKLLLFPSELLKEWNCPVRNNFFVYIFTPMHAVSFLVYDIGHNNLWDPARFARALWWMGAVPIALLTFVRVGSWLSPQSTIAAKDVTPAWMLTPTANLLAGLVAVAMPILPHHEAGVNGHTPFNTELFGQSSSSHEIASFFFMIGCFLWVVLFAATFFATVTSTLTTKTARSTSFFYLMPPCLAGLGYLAINLAKATDKIAVVATFAGTFYLAAALLGSLFFTALLSIGNEFATSYKFDMSHWNYCFPLDCVAASASMYYQLSGFKIAFALKVICFFLAFAANVICTVQTAAGIVTQRNVFIPERL